MTPTQREREGGGIAETFVFAKIHVCSVTLVAFAPGHDRGQARAFLACWRRRRVAKVQRFAAAAAADAVVFFLSFFVCLLVWIEVKYLLVKSDGRVETYTVYFSGSEGRRYPEYW